MILSLLILSVIICRSHNGVVHASQVKLKFGRTELIGLGIEPHHQEFYGGIPFAEPPVANLRFQPPVHKGLLNVSTFDAQTYGTRCLQPPQYSPPNASFSEDCLTINALRPAGLELHHNAPLPVMAWFYGRGFYAGDSSYYNGSEIVAHSVSRGTPVVFVDFNYRVSPLGFPQGVEADKRGILNLGLQDQLAALEWIQQNIHYFGGDKNKVTLFGESAGATSVGIFLLHPEIKHFARGAILESNTADVASAYNATGKPSRQVDWQNFVGAVPACASLAKGYNTLPCLRNASSDSILQAFTTAYNETTEKFPWVPTIDGPGGFLPDLPSRLWESGRFARVPFITGSNLDQGTAFYPPNVSYTADVIRELLVANYTPTELPAEEFEKVVNRTLELYPDDPSLGSPFGTGNETFGYDSSFKRISAINTDMLFTAPRRQWIQSASNAGVDTWGYLFTDPQVPSLYGPTHHAQDDYVFGTLNTTESTQQSPVKPLNITSALELSDIIQDYWISFATSLDPNDGKGNTRPRWTKYKPSSQDIIQLDSRNITMIPDTYRQKQNDFFIANAVAFRR